MSEPAISVRNLSKRYQLGTIGRHTLVDECQYWWHKLRGRDPREHFSKIGHTATEARKVEAEQKGADQFWALKDVSFDVQPGEVIGIIGRNGAGKSTLLKILSRITEPTTGEVVINGRVGSLLEVGTGFHPELTGRENVYMNGTILGMKKREIESKFDEIIAFAEIEKFLDTPVKRYSSGMYVRLAFSVAAHLDPEILVVDEVLAVGDAAFQAKCLGKLANVAGEGRTILFVSHNMTAVSNLCSRAILMANGSICCEGNASDIIESYTLVGRQLAQKDLTHRNDRTGRGHVRLSSIRTMDTDSRERIVFPTGADVLVDLEYKSALQQPLRRVSVALNVRNSLGSIVFSCWNEMSGDHFDEMPPNGHLVCNISSIPLPCGTYALDANVSVNRELADKISDIGSFTIEGGDYFGTGKVLQQKHGQVFVKHRWWTHA